MEILDTADAGPVRREYVRVSVACDGERDAKEADGGVEEVELEELLLKRLVWLNMGFGVGGTSSSFTGGGTPWTSLLSARYRLDCEGEDWSYFTARKEESLVAGDNPIKGEKREDREYVDDMVGRSANSVSHCLR
jgi:hypothetical protein